MYGACSPAALPMAHVFVVSHLFVWIAVSNQLVLTFRIEHKCAFEALRSTGSSFELGLGCLLRHGWGSIGGVQVFPRVGCEIVTKDRKRKAMEARGCTGWRGNQTGS